MLSKLLAQCYLTQQPWQEYLMPEADAIDYFDVMISRGNIIAVTSEDETELLGYVESWKINFEQFGRIVCKANFWTKDENTINGNICFLANIWISPGFRKGMVFKEMELRFFANNNDCEYYSGFAWRKKTKPVKVFTKNQLSSKLFTGADIWA